MKIAINGTGRIGKLVIRKLLENENHQIVLINTKDIEDFIYLLSHDSVHGFIEYNFKIFGNILQINNHKILITSIMDITTHNWNQYDFDIMLDCTGIYKETKLLKSYNHKTIVSAPTLDTKTIVLGVNESSYNNEQIISNASCTTNCVGEIIKLVNENFSIIKGNFITIHATTSSQYVVDKRNKRRRLGRSALDNIIPTTTGATNALVKIYPQIENKLSSLSYRIPISNGSVVDMNLELNVNYTINEILEILEKNKSKYISFIDRDIVSKDIIGSSYSCIIDKKLCSYKNNILHLVLWYDNESGYSSRMIDLIDIIKN